MKTQTLLGLCLSASLVLAAPAAMADKGKGKGKPQAAKAQAMQIQIDKKTGKKMSAPDDSDLSVKPAASETVVDQSGRMSLKSQGPQYHADGSISAKLGTENMEYLVLRVDEDGKKIISHQTPEEFDAQAGEQQKTQTEVAE